MKRILSIAAVLLLGVAVLVYSGIPLIKPVFHSDTVRYYAGVYDMDPLLITSLIKVESKFAPRARSHRGAVGLMQLMPATAREIAVELGYKNPAELNLEDPRVNIHMGTYYLHKLQGQFDGNLILALAAYNAGMNKVQRWYLQNPLIDIEITDIPYRETRNYVKNVLRTYRWLKKIQELKNHFRTKKA